MRPVPGYASDGRGKVQTVRRAGMSNLLLPLALTLLAGLSTGIGGGIALIAGHTNRTFLSVSLGFSAGVMI